MIEIETQTSNTQSDDRPLVRSLRRGFRQTCPACGEGRIYKSFLKIADTCPTCREELHHHRADDAPPYFTILIVGHVIGAGILMLEQAYAPDTWIHYVIWLPLLLGMTFWFLPRVKGALVGLQWSLRMHGFAGPEMPDQDSTSLLEPPAR